MKAEGKHPMVDAHALVAEMNKSRVADMHTFALLLVFTPPFILSMWYPTNKESVYFNGYGAYSAICVPILICALHVAQRFMKSPPKLLFVGSFWIPALFFVCIGAVYMNEARKHHNNLSGSECQSSSEGGDLQKAYKVAYTVASHCRLPNGAVQANSVMGCPGYKAALAEWEEEFTYLKELESQHQCGGFCKGSVRLWYGAGERAPSCRTFVQERLAAIHSLSSLLLWYNVIVMVFAAPMYIFLAPIFSKIGYGDTFS
jgi:hypothetical protein